LVTGIWGVKTVKLTELLEEQIPFVPETL
jgi:hypothetical protein